MGTGTWDVGCEAWDSGTRRRGDPGWWNASMRGDSRTWDVGTGGRDKQTSPDFCAESVSRPVADDFQRSWRGLAHFTERALGTEMVSP